MRLRELVRAPAFTCAPGTTLTEAAHLLHQHDAGSLVVIDEGGALVGIVTDRDIALKGYGDGLAGSTPVERVMTSTVATIGIDADSDDAAVKLLDHGVRRLPVMDGDRLCGVVTLDDLTMFVEREGDLLRRVLASQAVHEAPGWAHTWDEG
jgi:CBS domain-containing protein